MGSQNQNQKLHVIFLPYPTPGHMNPMVNTAMLFAKHGASVTIITTHSNFLIYQDAIIDIDNIRTHLIQFPASQVGLPDSVENFKSATSIETLTKLSIGLHMLRPQIEALFQELQPDCLVTDMFYPWTVESSAKLGIPRLYFYTSSYFSNCVRYSIRKHKPHEGLESDNQKFTIPALLHDNIEITKLQLEDWIRTENELTNYFNPMTESESRSYGALYNSFDEVEGGYEKFYKNTMGIKAWSIGPVSAWINKNEGEKKAKRVHKEELSEDPEWLNWLNSKQNYSVLYVNFGSLVRLPIAQIVEIAHGLENSGHNFIWVIRKKDGDDEDHGDGDNFLQGFEQRMKQSKQGYIMWNWAPQVLILDHPSIGGIVTHCGWNSILEGLNCGLPMITWPMFAEQFYNERLVVDVLKIGVSIGVKENKLWTSFCEDDVVMREEITKAVVVLMGSDDEESIEMRKRARKISDAAKKTIEEGGTSYNNLMQLIDELKSLKISRAFSKELDI